MAAKFNFNKEMLIKHRFWVMLGTAVTLILGGILCLEFVSADDTIEAVKKSVNAVKSIKGPIPNQPAIDALANEAKKALDSESKVWSKAFADQQEIFKWSPKLEEEFHFYDGLFATDIKLTKMADAKTPLPKDTPTVMHGIPKDQDPISFMLETKSGKKKFYDTPGLTKITFTDDKNMTIQFPELKNQAGRYAAVTYQNGRYFGDMLTALERRKFAETYLEQVRPILQSVDPLDDTGKGVVQLKNWLFKSEKPEGLEGLPHEDGVDQRFINYVKVPWNRQIDFSKGAWIAQEDLWIQKEIYRIIAETNNSVSQFKGEGGNVKNKAYVFTNSYFELTLVLQNDNSISMKVQNLLNRRQRLDQTFTVKISDAAGFDPEVIKISAEPLMPKGDAGKKDTWEKIMPAPKGVVRKGIFDVRQVLTWETAAIKRIDQVSIGSNASNDISHGHRTYPDNLRPLLDADIGAPDDVGQGALVAGGQPPGPKVGGGVKGPPVNKGRGPGVGSAPGPRPGQNQAINAGANGQKIPHDLWLTRYVEVSDQSRRIPVAIALIIDQEHVDRVLTHFNNSKLRFLETQVILNYYPGSLQPPAAPDAKIDPARPFGQPGLKGPGAQPGGQSGGSAETETNMEIVIYGIMTLYQRYPPRPTVAPPAGAVGTAPPAAGVAPPAVGVAPPGDKKDR